MVMKSRNLVAHLIMWCHNPTDTTTSTMKIGAEYLSYILNTGPHVQANRAT